MEVTAKNSAVRECVSDGAVGQTREERESGGRRTDSGQPPSKMASPEENE